MINWCQWLHQHARLPDCTEVMCLFVCLSLFLWAGLVNKSSATTAAIPTASSTVNMPLHYGHTLWSHSTNVTWISGNFWWHFTVLRQKNFDVPVIIQLLTDQFHFIFSSQLRNDYTYTAVSVHKYFYLMLLFLRQHCMCLISQLPHAVTAINLRVRKQLTILHY